MNRSSLLLLVALLGAALVLALTTRPAPAGAFRANDHERWVVRATFDDPQMVATVAAWAEPWAVNYEEGYLVVVVNEQQQAWLLAAGFRVEVDVNLTRELYRPRARLPGQVSGIPGFPCYRTVEETYATAQQLADAHPRLAQRVDVGDSWEKAQNAAAGYDMMVLRLSNGDIAGPKPQLFVMSAVHAREYATAELNTRFAEYLLQNYGVDADVTWLLDYHEIHLMLQANPDGRKRAEAGSLWRKNTNNNYCSDTSLRGADLNRNYSFQWGCCGGSSSSQCEEIYRGPAPASEPETQAVQNYVRAHFPDQRADALTAAAPLTSTGVFLDLHSYGQLVLWPWSFSDSAAPNGAALRTLGRKLAFFNDYTATQAINLYPTDGTTDDFAYGELGLAAYAFELGTWFFQSCSSFEDTIWPDNLPALLYAAKAARQPYALPAGPDAHTLTLDAAEVTPGTPVRLAATLDDTRFVETAGEPVKAIAAAEYYVDAPPWITSATPVSFTMAAADGAFDSTVEIVEAVIDTTGWADGRHTLFVRGRDAAGNWGQVSAVFLRTAAVIAPAAAFSSNSPLPLGAPAVFTNTSGGSNLAYTWDFGDGSAPSDEANPTHTYAAPSTYTVTLTASNVLGSDSFAAALVVLPGPERHLYFPFIRRPLR